MKYMIASDIHGSAWYCRKMMEALEKEQADRLILLGDLLYHGPRNDLPKEYAPKEVIRMLNKEKNRKRFSVFVETAMRKWTRWYWNFRYWQIMAGWKLTGKHSI